MEKPKEDANDLLIAVSIFLFIEVKYSLMEIDSSSLISLPKRLVSFVEACIKTGACICKYDSIF